MADEGGACIGIDAENAIHIYEFRFLPAVQFILSDLLKS